MHPFAYATGYAENKVFHLGEMLKEDDRIEFFRAIEKEVEGHNQGNH